jgi:hypothetical protein
VEVSHIESLQDKVIYVIHGKDHYESVLLKIGTAQYPLVKVSHVKFNQSWWKSLWNIKKSPFIAFCKLALLWINMKMDDSQIFPTPLHESLPC